MLRNTRWIYGIVVFTGHESKLMKNASPTPAKTTRVEKQVNKHIIYLFFVLVALSVVSAFGAFRRELYGVFEKNIMMIDSSNAFFHFLKNILTYVILYNNLIPMRFFKFIVV